VDKIIRFCLEQKLVVVLITLFVVFWGIAVAPFDWDTGALPRRPVSVDAIPDIGEKQQIVFTEWMGRSPQDVDDQITYPLTTYLLGVPGVKTVRSYSFFGFSSIYVIFQENVDFYWGRSRILEKLNSIPPGILPDGVNPSLGPDATALGQIYEYTLEGRDPDGKPAGGWDLQELRSVQDWYVRFSLLSAEGISEVASVGGFVKEYQVDVDPDAMRAYNVTLDEVYGAVRSSNVDVGAMTIEINRVDYMIRGLGFIRQISDVENAVIKSNEGVPIYVKNVARVSLGPQYRRGALDKAGAEAVGGVVVVRYGFNPLEAIKNVKAKIEAISPALPTKAVVDFRKVSEDAVGQFAAHQGFEGFEADKLNQPAWKAWLAKAPRAEWPEWVTTSHVTIIPFYDRTGLIYETLGTLKTALTEEILITIIVVVVMVFHLRSSILISSTMPLAVLFSFIAMKLVGVDANLVSLSGIAIAIGTIVDMGIIITENILKHLADALPEEDRLEVVYRAASEVGSAILTAVATTIVGFLPVFAMTGPEGKLFRPLAFTKTFCLMGSIIVALTIIPAGAHLLIAGKPLSGWTRRLALLGLAVAGVVIGFHFSWWAGILIVLMAIWQLASEHVSPVIRKAGPWVVNIVALLFVGVLLTMHWLPLSPEKGLVRNLVFTGVLLGGMLAFYRLFQWVYEPLLRWFLAHKLIFLCAPTAVVLFGACVWLGFGRVFAVVPDAAEKVGIPAEKVRQTTLWVDASHALPGLGKEFMPPLDEGSFLYMPTTMPHASIGEAMDVLQKQDMALRAIPEVESVVGKIGRVESALDPAPVGMIETVINYKPEYMTDKDGARLRFRYNAVKGEFVRDRNGELVPDPRGRPYRQWRDQIHSADDIWTEITRAAEIPGTTTAPRLQPIAARIVMLQSGMRAPMGVKVKGPDLPTIERVGLDVERLLKEVPTVEAAAVIADRVVGSPYIEIEIDRQAAARYGVPIRMAQDVIETAIGGQRTTTTVEGRERYPVRVRYLRELRDNIDSLGRILVPASNGAQVPLIQLADIRYVRGPEAVKSEDTFLVSYVLFDKKPGYAEVDVVEQCQQYLKEKEASGEFVRPAGVEITFAGTYENQLHARKTLAVVLPLALFVIFMILYFQFKSVLTTGLVFSTILVCWGAGFLMIWLYGRPWFLDLSVFGVNMRDLFQIHTINLSVAIWVGFLALFGIASDDGVVMATYLDQSFTRMHITSVAEIREATVAGGLRRVRPCLMTTATTVLALLPVLTSTGRGADIMVPMAIPSFGGMFLEVMTLFVVPVLYCAIKEFKLRTGIKDAHFEIGEET
jgi:Cu(I)/Ag(I) efflux system membrane protein CusA/SilA